jgi:hypothetical protein
MDIHSDRDKEIELQLTSSSSSSASPLTEGCHTTSKNNNDNIIIKQLDIADGLKELLITHNLLSLESILTISSSDLANTLGIDQHVAEIISIAAKKQIKAFEQMR